MNSDNGKLRQYIFIPCVKCLLATAGTNSGLGNFSDEEMMYILVSHPKCIS